MLESRLRHPLIRLGIFRMRSITGANAAMLLVAGGMFALFYLRFDLRAGGARLQRAARRDSPSSR